MVITGIITLVVAVLFWYVILLSLTLYSDDMSGPSCRFFFPDSPTTAYFLTPSERLLAVQRIKSNQAGTENKHWKRDQYVHAPFLYVNPC